MERPLCCVSPRPSLSLHVQVTNNVLNEPCCLCVSMGMSGGAL